MMKAPITLSPFAIGKAQVLFTPAASSPRNPGDPVEDDDDRGGFRLERASGQAPGGHKKLLTISRHGIRKIASTMR